MNVFITKYALSSGIQVRTSARVCTDISENMIECGRMEYFHKPHWHTTWADAEKQARKMRDAKIKSVEKQLTRLRALEFAEPR